MLGLDPVLNDLILLFAVGALVVGVVYLLAAVGVRLSARRTYDYDSSAYDKYNDVQY